MKLYTYLFSPTFVRAAIRYSRGLSAATYTSKSPIQTVFRTLLDWIKHARGFWPSLMTRLLFTTVYLLCKELLYKQVFQKKQHDDHVSVVYVQPNTASRTATPLGEPPINSTKPKNIAAVFVSDYISSILSFTLFFPLDVILRKQQHPLFWGQGMLQVIRHIKATEGWRGFYSGLGYQYLEWFTQYVIGLILFFSARFLVNLRRQRFSKEEETSKKKKKSTTN
jgi:hypothetical protein